MHFDLTEVQRLTQEMVRMFAEKEVKPRVALIDRTDEFPWDLYRRMGELGLLGMTLPSEYGGAGADTITWAVAQEEHARVYQIWEGASQIQRSVIGRRLFR